MSEEIQKRLRELKAMNPEARDRFTVYKENSILLDNRWLIYSTTLAGKVVLCKMEDGSYPEAVIEKEEIPFVESPGSEYTGTPMER